MPADEAGSLSQPVEAVTGAGAGACGGCHHHRVLDPDHELAPRTALQLDRHRLPGGVPPGSLDFVPADDAPDRSRGEEAPPTTISRHAFRIVQECLTNARRHAPGQPVTVELQGRPGRELVIRVENPVVAAAAAGSGSGHGLDGLAERARLVGGHLTVDSTADRHVVEARLPWTR